jgi:ABC-2 type transport system ATP-binding protein
MEKIVKVDGLTKIFNSKFKAVDNVTFSVYEGEIFGFLGPNGAGKTTTIKMLTTLLKPTSGTATVCGYDIVRQADTVRASVGVVPQEYTADEDMTGYENIMFCAALYGIPKEKAKERAEELLELVGLKDSSTKKVMNYSGGMRRRLEIACGLINHPRLLFLDEPTLGLDVQTRTAVWEYIKKLKVDYGMTLFMTTHYLEEADSVCDRIAIIDHGKLIKIGTPSELKAGIGGDIIEVGVMEREPDISQLIMNIKYVKEVKRIDNFYRIKSESGEEAAPAIMEKIRASGLHVTRISLSKPSLDQVYLEYTGRNLRDEQADSSDIIAQRFTLRRARA